LCARISRHCKKQEEDWHANAIIETTFHVKAFADLSRHRLVGDYGLAKSCVGRRKDGRQDGNFQGRQFVKYEDANNNA
jgi:hypothetical protein